MYIIGLEVVFFFCSFLSNVYRFSITRDTVSNRLLSTPAHQRQSTGTNESVKIFANSWICFTKRPCLNFGYFPVLIACLQSEIDTGKKWPLREKAKSASLYILPFARNRCLFMWGCLFLCGCLLSRFYG